MVVFSLLVGTNSYQTLHKVNDQVYCNRTLIDALQARGAARQAGDLAAQKRDVAWMPWLAQLERHLRDGGPEPDPQIFDRLVVAAQNAISARSDVMETRDRIPIPDCPQ